MADVMGASLYKLVNAMAGNEVTDAEAKEATAGKTFGEVADELSAGTAESVGKAADYVGDLTATAAQIDATVQKVAENGTVNEDVFIVTFYLEDNEWKSSATKQEIFAAFENNKTVCGYIKYLNKIIPTLVKCTKSGGTVIDVVFQAINTECPVSDELVTVVYNTPDIPLFYTFSNSGRSGYIPTVSSGDEEMTVPMYSGGVDSNLQFLHITDYVGLSDSLNSLISNAMTYSGTLITSVIDTSETLSALTLMFEGMKKCVYAGRPLGFSLDLNSILGGDVYAYPKNIQFEDETLYNASFNVILTQSAPAGFTHIWDIDIFIEANYNIDETLSRVVLGAYCNTIQPPSNN